MCNFSKLFRYGRLGDLLLLGRLFFLWKEKLHLHFLPGLSYHITGNSCAPDALWSCKKYQFPPDVLSSDTYSFSFCSKLLTVWGTKMNDRQNYIEVSGRRYEFYYMYSIDAKPEVYYSVSKSFIVVECKKKHHTYIFPPDPQSSVVRWGESRVGSSSFRLKNLTILFPM